MFESAFDNWRNVWQAKAFVILALSAASVAPRTTRIGTHQAGFPPTSTHANILRGEYSRYRANNDLLYYDLDIRVDPEKKFVRWVNTIRFKMLKYDTRIQ